ncbi:hypothetical protein [Lactiplantibacillus paraxiangfangensis]|uniref:hypothetical protein n=1 Tax=Lactiplantibacillus paraxiangfangensis TaxID=3076224 RepID=UPI0030C6D60B
MELYNVKAFAFKTLSSVKAIKCVATTYPDKFTVYPIAVYSTTHSANFRDANMQELRTDWKIVIDLFTDQGSLTSIIDELTTLFSAAGFSNTVSEQNLAGVNRAVITLTGLVDNENHRVFQK